MRLDRGRLLRAVLLSAAGGVALAVALNLRRPGPPPEGPAGPAPQATAAAPPPGAPATRMDELVYRNVKGGRETFVLRARSMRGREQEEMRLETVALEFVYLAEGAPRKGTIDSDECVYFPTRQEAFFQGHVRLRTDDGFELRTEQLVYQGQQQEARSDRAFEFQRGDVSGRAKGFLYKAQEGTLDLSQDVFVRIEGERQPAAEIRSRRAQLRRAVGEMDFQEDVDLVRGPDALRSERLLLIGSEDEIDRARAAGGVVVRTQGDSLLAGGRTRANAGPRELRCQQLDLNFRLDRSLEEAGAHEDAQLVIEPGRGEPRERRILRGALLGFHWDEQGRLDEAIGQKGAEFVAEPLPPAKGPARRIRARSFVVGFDPATGATRRAEFNREVEFERGTQRAKAERGEFDGEKSTLLLKEDPRLWDDAEGTRLDAPYILIHTPTGNLKAWPGARHTVERKAGGSGLFSPADGPVSLNGQLFEYDAQARTGRYAEGALLRSGKSEVRAASMTVVEAEDGRRRLEAQGEVAARLQPRRGGTGEPPPASSEARAKSMVYDEVRQTIHYSGDVFLRQGEVSTKSPEATVSLTPEGDAKSLVAGAPVELTQGERRVTGGTATYLPADRTIVVVGEHVELKEPTQNVAGRSLTFFVGDDRILVDGRERTRTETILRRQPPKP